MAIDIGIDLGTTNSVMAYEDDRTGVQVIADRRGARSTKSAVGLHHSGGQTLVGNDAIDYAVANPKHTILSIKRLVGRFFEDPNVQTAKSKVAYTVVKSSGGDDVSVMLGDRMLTPVEVSAMILRRMKEEADAVLNTPVTHVVITVPAYFSINQRLATRNAGELAGLRVKQIISEPTAAAMAFGVDLEPGTMKNVLVYDLGGGTFDISILFITGEMFNELGIEGDMWLGGDDFDHAIVQYVLRAIQQEHGTDPSNDKNVMARLRRVAEAAKIKLSEMMSTHVVLESMPIAADGKLGDIDVCLTRREFEDLPISSNPIEVSGVDEDTLRTWCESLGIDDGTYDAKRNGRVQFGPDTLRNRIKKTLLLARKAMAEAGVTLDQIDHVLLVGGSTIIPLVQEMAEKEFGAGRIMRNIDPMECVARGAGIAARRIQQIICAVDQEPNDRDATRCRKCGAELVQQLLCPECRQPNSLDATTCVNPACAHAFKRLDLSGVTAKPVGIVTAANAYEVIVPKSTAYPMSGPVVRPFRTATDTKKAIRIPIFQAEVGEFDPKDFSLWIGAADIKLEGRSVPAGTKVDVSILIDSNGIFRITSTVQDGSGQGTTADIDPRLGIGRQQAEEEAATVAADKWRNNLSWSIAWARIAVRDYDWLLTGSQTVSTPERLVKEAKRVLEEGNETDGRRLEKEIDKTLEDDLKGFMQFLWAEMRALNEAIEPAVRNKIRTLISEMKDLVRRQGDPDEFRRKVDELQDLMISTRGAGREREDTRLVK
jgi:molecular chaperone DnaK